VASHSVESFSKIDSQLGLMGIGNRKEQKSSTWFFALQAHGQGFVARARVKTPARNAGLGSLEG